MFFKKKKRQQRPLRTVSREDAKNLARAFLSLDQQAAATSLALLSGMKVQKAGFDQFKVFCKKLGRRMEDWADEKLEESDKSEIDNAKAPEDKQKEISKSPKPEISSANDYMQRRIQTSVETHCANHEATFSRIQVLDELISFFCISPSPLDSVELASDALGKIAEKTHALLDKQYESYNGQNLDEMASFAISRLIQEQFDKSSDEQQQELVEKLDQFFKELEEKDRVRIQERLGLDELSQKTLKGLLVGGGAYALAGAIFSMGGFASYTLLTQFMSITLGWLFSALGLGLSPYIFATSAFSVAFSFVGFGLVAIFGGVKIYKKNTLIKEQLIPIVVSLAYIEWRMKEEAEVDASILKTTSFWEDEWGEYFAIRDELEDLKRQKDNQSNLIFELDSQKTKLNFEAGDVIRKTRKEQNALRMEVTTVLTDLSDDQLKRVGFDSGSVKKAIEARHARRETVETTEFNRFDKWLDEDGFDALFETLTESCITSRNELQLTSRLAEILTAWDDEQCNEDVAVKAYTEAKKCLKGERLKLSMINTSIPPLESKLWKSTLWKYTFDKLYDERHLGQND